jgi:hypothetical protein
MFFQKGCDEVTHTLIGVVRQRKEPYPCSFNLVAKDYAGIDSCVVAWFLEDARLTSIGLKCPVAGMDASSIFI